MVSNVATSFRRMWLLLILVIGLACISEARAQIIFNASFSEEGQEMIQEMEHVSAEDIAGFMHRHTTLRYERESTRSVRLVSIAVTGTGEIVAYREGKPFMVEPGTHRATEAFSVKPFVQALNESLPNARFSPATSGLPGSSFFPAASFKTSQKQRVTDPERMVQQILEETNLNEDGVLILGMFIPADLDNATEMSDWRTYPCGLPFLLKR